MPNEPSRPNPFMTNTTPAPPAPANTAIKAADLATFRTTPDGNLKVKLERFGCVTIELPNSEASLEVYVTRSTEGERPFMTYVTAEVKHDGRAARGTHCLCTDGALRILSSGPVSKKDRQQSTGREAAAAEAAIPAATAEANPEPQPEHHVEEAATATDSTTSHDATPVANAA